MKTIKKNTYLNREGIGFNLIKHTYNNLGLNLRKREIAIKLNHKKVMFKILNQFSYNNSLKFKLEKRIDYYKSLKNYKGTRHLYKYPVRGQRTHTNAKTRKRKNLISANEEESKYGKTV